MHIIKYSTPIYSSLNKCYFTIASCMIVFDLDISILTFIDLYIITDYI